MPSPDPNHGKSISGMNGNNRTKKDCHGPAMRATQLKATGAAQSKTFSRGKFQPHGDQAVYDALVRLAQDFAVRYPLVEGQGNFGNVDGDNAAAMRYTESRLTAVAQTLLEGLDEDAVDFRPTYDGEDREPV